MDKSSNTSFVSSLVDQTNKLLLDLKLANKDLGAKVTYYRVFRQFFFTIHYNPSLAYIAVRDLQSSLRNASVQSLQLAGNFLHNQ